MKHLQADLSTYKHRTTPTSFSTSDLPKLASTEYVRSMKLSSDPLPFYKVCLFTGSCELVLKPLTDLPLLTDPTLKVRKSDYYNSATWVSFDNYVTDYLADYYFNNLIDAKLFLYRNSKETVRYPLDDVMEVYPEYFV